MDIVYFRIDISTVFSLKGICYTYDFQNLRCCFQTLRYVLSKRNSDFNENNLIFFSNSKFEELISNLTLNFKEIKTYLLRVIPCKNKVFLYYVYKFI